MLICEWRGRHLWVAGVWFGQVVQRGCDRPYHRKPYCGRLMTEEDGGELSWFSTEREARKFLVAKAYAWVRTAARTGEGLAQDDQTLTSIRAPANAPRSSPMRQTVERFL